MMSWSINSEQVNVQTLPKLFPFVQFTEPLVGGAKAGHVIAMKIYFIQ